LKIGIEARWMIYEKTGFGNYASNFLKEISRIDDNNEYSIYLNDDYENDIFLKSNFKKIIIKRRPETYKHFSIPLDIIMKKRKYDFYHYLYNAPSLLLPCPFILTIHDVSYKHIPNMISRKDLLSIIFQMSINAKRAARIISVSENTRNDIVNFFKVPEDRIEVIYEGVDDTFRVIKDADSRMRIACRYGLPEKFMLYVGTYLPHKNLETLLNAFCELKKNCDIPHKLVLAGKKGRNYESISRQISLLNLDEDVLTIGFVPDEDLPGLYNLSDVFIFPSLYEGFGLPLLEAMACGVPVISSRASCLPEIGGDGAVYFSPGNAQELADKVLEIINNISLRNIMIEKGLKRSKLFSWEKMAEKTLSLYEDLSRNYFKSPLTAT
jgi:glycosyltransferase involved in cell wall biosynthesis